MSRDGQDLEWKGRDQRRDESRDHWATHFLRLLPTPVWQTRHENLPTLAAPIELNREWRMRFSGGSAPEMRTFGFETTPKAVVRFLGVAVPKDQRPTSWLIYFRHTAKKQDFSNNLLTLGAGDYLVGRMQAAKQVALSGKAVGVIVPVALATLGEFAGNEAFVTQCLREIEMSIYGTVTQPSLLAASNSDGLFSMRNFLARCPVLVGRLKAIYDFDGSHIVHTESITLAVKGVKTLRYEGRLSPTPASWAPHETEESFLFRRMNQNPARVPLALSRWREHPRIHEIRPHEDPKRRPKLGDKTIEAQGPVDWNWLHHHIPTCMLHHALMSTPGI